MKLATIALVTLVTAPASDLDLFPRTAFSDLDRPLTSEESAREIKIGSKETDAIQNGPRCLPRLEMPASITAGYGEEVAWRGQLLGINEVWIMLAPDRKSWSLLARPDGEDQVCFILGGRAWNLERVLWQRESGAPEKLEKRD